jgi:hypothetical protein
MSEPYTPTTDEVETAFHEFASLLEVDEPGTYPEAPEFSDWREARDGFHRWLADMTRQAKADTESALTGELAAAQAQLAAVRTCLDSFSWHESDRGFVETTGRYAQSSADALDAAIRQAKAEAWDECLDAIERYELNTEQARSGNPYPGEREGADRAE